MKFELAHLQTALVEDGGGDLKYHEVWLLAVGFNSLWYLGSQGKQCLRASCRNGNDKIGRVSVFRMAAFDWPMALVF